AVKRLVYCFPKNRRADFHRADFIDHHDPLAARCFTNRFDADGFQGGEIKPVFSNALRRFEIDVSKYSLVTIERHDLESNARAVLTHLFSVKTTSASREIIYNTLDQCRLAAAGRPVSRTFPVTARASDSADKTMRCGRRSLMISIRARSADTCRLCRAVAT